MASAATEILYGVHPLQEALRAGQRRFDALYIRRGRSERRLASIAAAAVDRDDGHAARRPCDPPNAVLGLETPERRHAKRVLRPG